MNNRPKNKSTKKKFKTILSLTLPFPVKGLGTKLKSGNHRHNFMDNGIHHIHLCYFSAFAFYQVTEDLVKSRSVSEMLFTTSTNIGNFKFVVILKSGVCALVPHYVTLSLDEQYNGSYTPVM